MASPERVAELYALRSTTDSMLAKALDLSETARMARIEVVLREFVDRAWEARAARAADAAAKDIRSGSGQVTDADIERAVRSVDKEMAKWAEDIGKRFTDDVARIYVLGRQAGGKKVTRRTRADLDYTTPHFGPFVSDQGDLDRQRANKATSTDFAAITSLDLVDQNAVEAMKEQQLFWIGRHYEENVSRGIGDNIREHVLAAGRGREEAGRSMSEVVRTALRRVEIPSGWVGTSKQYFEGLVANASTVARVNGQMRSFEKSGAVSYEIVNPSDRRTCPQCAHMNGKEFTVETGLTTMRNALSAKTPDAVRKAHPWVGLSGVRDLSARAGKAGKKDAKRLSEAGVNLPPFHFRCRCTVDITRADERLPDVPDQAPSTEKPIKTADFKAKPLPRKTIGDFREKTRRTLDATGRQESSFETRRRAARGIAERLEGDATFDEWMSRKMRGFSNLPAEERGRMRGREVEDLISLWNSTSGDRNQRAVLMQLAAQEEFGLRESSLAHIPKDFLNRVKREKGADLPAMRRLLRAQYDNTQEWLRANKIDSVFLYRGAGWDRSWDRPDVKWDKGRHTVDLVGQPMSSYSGDPQVSIEFTSGLGGGGSDFRAMFAAEVPAERIIGVPQTGYGVKGEVEFVVLGGKDKHLVIGTAERDGLNPDPERMMDQFSKEGG